MSLLSQMCRLLPLLSLSLSRLASSVSHLSFSFLHLPVYSPLDSFATLFPSRTHSFFSESSVAFDIARVSFSLRRILVPLPSLQVHTNLSALLGLMQTVHRFTSSTIDCYSCRISSIVYRNNARIKRIPRKTI